MRKKLLIFICFLLSSASLTKAQLPDGSDAPDFTATDIYGDSHQLHTYLENGYSVLLKFSATWCGICWNYHNSGVLTDIWEQFGPQGSNEVIILFIEGDLQTGVECLFGNCQGTQGNWTMLTPYPIINDHSMNVPYEISGYPTLIGIHPDGKTRDLGQADVEKLTEFIIEGRYTGYTASVSQITCAGAQDGSIELKGDNDSLAYSYLWNTGSTDASLTDLAQGVYRATISDGNGGNLITEDFIIREPEPLLLVETFIQHINCKHLIGSVSLEAEGGNGSYEYIWSNGQYGNQLVAFMPGAYYVTVTDILNCQATREVNIVKNTDLPEIDAGEDYEIPCDTEWPLMLQSYSDNTGLIYRWTHENGELADNANEPDVWIESTGLFRVTVTDTLTGCTNFDEVGVYYEMIQKTIAFADITCYGSPTGWIELSLFTNIPYEIKWSNGKTGNKIENIPSGQYQAQATISACQENYVFDISSPDIPLKVDVETLLISDKTEGLIEVTVTGGWGDYYIEWFFEDIRIETNKTFLKVITPGDYTIVVKDSGGCEERVIISMDLSTSTTSFIKNPSIRIHPNPAKDFAIIEGLDLRDINTIEITDYSGRVVKSLYFNDYKNNYLDITQLESSPYIMKINYTDGNSELVKFIKL